MYCILKIIYCYVCKVVHEKKDGATFIILSVVVDAVASDTATVAATAAVTAAITACEYVLFIPVHIKCINRGVGRGEALRKRPNNCVGRSSRELR